MFLISTCLHIACGVLVHCETSMRLISKSSCNVWNQLPFKQLWGLSAPRNAVEGMLFVAPMHPMEQAAQLRAQSHQATERRASLNMRAAVEQPAHAGGV